MSTLSILLVKRFFIFVFLKDMSPARWETPTGGGSPAELASSVVSGKVEKIRENKEHLVPRPFTLNNNERKVRMVAVCFNLVWRENRTFVQRKRKTRERMIRESRRCCWENVPNFGENLAKF